MKQRVTYILPQGSEVDLSYVNVNEERYAFNGYAEAAVEKRLTVGLDELPAELSGPLKKIHELHVRWVSQASYSASSPFVSRLPPGLHVSYTPAKEGKEHGMCLFLRTTFNPDMKCFSVQESFSRPSVISERFASSSTYQYYHELPKLIRLQAGLAKYACKGDMKCVNQVATLGNAKYVDIDYDAISHVVNVNAFWTKDTARANPVHKFVDYMGEKHRVEVGVLQPEKADEPEELKFGGHLTVLGEDEKPGGTLFSFPSRHHPLPDNSKTTYSVAFQTPTGLHPKLDIKLSGKQLTPPEESCALHAYLTLPSALFIDRYQLSDPLFLQSQNLVSLHSLSGEDDLEAPDWVVKRWGSAALLELAHPDPSSKDTGKDWTITIPTHLRYLNSTIGPNNSSMDHVPLDISWPSLFWACEAEEGLKMNTNPFDRVNLGYDGLFGPKTMFYHVPPKHVGGSTLVEQLAVPVLGHDAADWVSSATLGAVALGFGWVCWKLLGGSGAKATTSAEKKAEKKTK